MRVAVRRWSLARSLRASLLPLLLLGVMPGPALALCAQSDAQHHRCCCPGHTAHEAAQAELATSCCCKLEQKHAPAQSSPTVRVESPRDQGVVLAELDQTNAPLPLGSATTIAPAPLHARGGPPLFILHRSLLI